MLTSHQQSGFRLRDLYGVASGGGQAGTLYWFGGPCYNSCVTVFGLSKTSGAPWITTILHQFAGGSDGGNPNGRAHLRQGWKPLRDDLFRWLGRRRRVRTVAHCLWLASRSTPLTASMAPLPRAVHSQGGTPGNGVVFKLSHASSRNWKETILHSFSVSDGAVPASGLLLDPVGEFRHDEFRSTWEQQYRMGLYLVRRCLRGETLA
jgi:hypothetical protein